MVYLFSQIGKQSIFVCLSTVRTATKPVGVGWCEVSDALFFCVLRTLSAASAFQLMNYSRAMYPAPVCFPLVVCVMLIYPFSMLQVSVMLSACVCDSRKFFQVPIWRITFIICVPGRINAAERWKWWKQVCFYIFRNVHLSLDAHLYNINAACDEKTGSLRGVCSLRRTQLVCRFSKMATAAL